MERAAKLEAVSGLEVAERIVDLPRWPQMLECGCGIVARQFDEAEHREVHPLPAAVSLLRGSGERALGAGAGVHDLPAVRRDHGGRQVPYRLSLGSQLRGQRKQIPRLAGGTVPVARPPLEHAQPPERFYLPHFISPCAQRLAVLVKVATATLEVLPRPDELVSDRPRSRIGQPPFE